MLNKKKIGTFITLSSAAFLLAACGNDGNATANNGKTEVELSALPEPGDYSEAVDLQLSGSFTKGKVEDDNWVQQKLEEQFNVNIENTKIDTWNNDETSIMVASGDLPDVFSFTTNKMTAKEFYDNGLTRTIPREMIEKYAPKYAQMLDEVDGGLGWQMNQAEGKEDEYLALTGIQTHTEGIVWTPTLRLDWMEKLGLELPEDMKPIGDSDGYERIYMSKQGYTIEELEKILHAFTYGDPDGNGKNDTYGMLPWNSDLNWGTSLFGAYGIAADYSLQEDGELKDPMVSNAYKDALLKLSDWYGKGLIDPEWTTLTVQTAWEKYATGSAGYFIAQRSYLAQEEWTKGRAPHNILEADPNAKLLMVAPEIGPDGKQGEQSYMPVTLLGETLKVAADVTDEELARYLQMFDFMHHDEAGVWTTYGNPGEHSDYLGEEGNSTLIVRPEFTREEGATGFWAYNFRTYPGKRFNWLTHMKTIELMDEFFANPEIVESMAIRPYKYDLFNETQYADLEGRYGAQLKTLEDEFRMNGIVGDINIESEWDSYVENWRNNGGQQMLEELDKAPLVTDLIGE